MAHGSIVGRGLDAHFVDGFRVGHKAGAPAVGSSYRVAIQQKLVGARAQAGGVEVGGTGVIQGPVVIRLKAAGEDHARGHGLQGEGIHGGVGQLADVARV